MPVRRINARGSRRANSFLREPLETRPPRRESTVKMRKPAMSPHDEKCATSVTLLSFREQMGIALFKKKDAAGVECIWRGRGCSLFHCASFSKISCGTNVPSGNEFNKLAGRFLSASVFFFVGANRVFGLFSLRWFHRGTVERLTNPLIRSNA